MIEIAGHKIGKSCFVVAEIGSNHCGDFEIACKLVMAAKQTGADAVKIQVYKPETMTIDSPRPEFQVNEEVYKGSLWNLYKKTAMPWDWIPKLKEMADDIGIVFFGSVFDKTSVDFLDQLNIPCYKIASPELVDLGLVRYAASKGKPMILSLGMARDYFDIWDAIKVCCRSRNKKIILLKCISSYPAKPEDMNLGSIFPLLEEGYPVGLSDHSLSNTAAIMAIGMGACMVEKHLKLDHADSPDSLFSLAPQQFASFVRDIREAETTIGVGQYGERGALQYRRSLYVVEDVKKGETFKGKVKSIRPARGLEPKYLSGIEKAQATLEIPSGTPLSWDMVDGGMNG